MIEKAKLDDINFIKLMLRRGFCQKFVYIDETVDDPDHFYWGSK